MKAKITLLTTAILLTITISSCKKPERPYILGDIFEITSEAEQFDGNRLLFEWTQQAATLVIITETATGQWEAFVPTNDVWCDYSRIGNKLIVTVRENNNRQSRSTFIELSLGDKRHRIDVYQRGLLFLEFEIGTDLALSAAEADISLPLRTSVLTENLTVSLGEPANWISSLAVNANNNVVFTVSRNTTGVSREATITVAGEGAEASINVTQYALGTIAVDHTHNVCPEPYAILTIEVDDTSNLKWYRNGDPIADATGTTFIATQSGIYTVSINGIMSPEREVIMTRCINADALIYEDFIGTYTMWFHNNTTTPPPVGTTGPRQFQTTVTLEPAIWGETYYLRGILSPADEALGSIIVKYNPETMRIEIWGQKLFERESGARPSFWLSPEGVAGANRARSNPTNAQGRGVASANHDISNGLRFELNHNGAILWTNTTATGFHLMNFTSDTDATNGTDVAGLSPIPSNGRFSHMLFERIEN